MVFALDIDKTLHAAGRTFHLDVHLRATRRRVVLFGPSGAGKSLTLKAVAGLLRPDRGRIVVDGAVLFDAAARIDIPPQGRRLGYLFQDYALFPHLTVRQNIGFGLARGWRNPSATQRDERVEHWLTTFELADQAGQYPHQLSGGQRQRTALARALVGAPRALLLDEPFAALDAGLRARMRAELSELQGRIDVPMLLITHDEADVRVFGEQVAQLREGRIVEGPDAARTAG